MSKDRGVGRGRGRGKPPQKDENKVGSSSTNISKDESSLMEQLKLRFLTDEPSTESSNSEDQIQVLNKQIVLLNEQNKKLVIRC